MIKEFNKFLPLCFTLLFAFLYLAISSQGVFAAYNVGVLCSSTTVGVGTGLNCKCVLFCNEGGNYNSTHFCSITTHMLYPKKEIASTCSKNYVCLSDKCNSNTGKCTASNNDNKGDKNKCSESGSYNATHFCSKDTKIYPKKGINSICSKDYVCLSGRCNITTGKTIGKCVASDVVCTAICDSVGGCERINTCNGAGCVKRDKCCGVICSTGKTCMEGVCSETSGGATPTCTSWTYSAWGACAKNVQTRTITSSFPIGCSGGSHAALSQSCSSGGDEKTYQCFVVKFVDKSGNDIHLNQIYGAVKFVDEGGIEGDSDDMNSYGYGYLTFAADDDNTGIGAYVVVKTQPKGYSCSTKGRGAWAKSVGSVKATNVESAREKCAHAYSDPAGKTTITCTKQCVDACSSDFCENNIAYYCTTNAQGCKVKGNTIPKPTILGTYVCENGYWKCSGSVKSLTSCFSVCNSCQCTCPSNCANTGAVVYNENCEGQIITREPHSFVANNQNEEILLKDFLGINPPGDDVDTYLRTRTNDQLDDWRDYWLLKLPHKSIFIHSKHKEYYKRLS